MSQNDTQETNVTKLTEVIHKINTNTEILVTKIEQLNNNVEKVEASVEDLHLLFSEQDRRLTVVEQIIPPNLVQDIAVLKSLSQDVATLKLLSQDVAVLKQGQSAHSKLLWLIGGITLTTFADMIFHLLTK